MDNSKSLIYDDLAKTRIDSIGLENITVECLKDFFNISKLSQLFILWDEIVTFANDHLNGKIHTNIIEDIKEKTLSYEKMGIKLGMSRFDLVTFGVEETQKEVCYTQKQLQILNSICDGSMKISDLNVIPTPDRTFYYFYKAGIHTVKELLSYNSFNYIIDDKYIKQMQRAIDLLGINELRIGMGDPSYLIVTYAEKLIKNQRLEDTVKPTKGVKQLQSALQERRYIIGELITISKEKEKLEERLRNLDAQIVSTSSKIDFAAEGIKTKKSK